MVLFLYVIMMLNLNTEVEPHKSKLLKIAATFASGLLMVVLVGVIRQSTEITALNQPDSQIGLIKNLGHVLYTDFMLPFEISSILLLAAMVGAVMIGKKEIK